MANTDRTALRTALKYHTDNKLTSSTDQDFYLNKAEQDVFAAWRKFDPGLFRPAIVTVTTSAAGLLSLPQSFTRLEYLEDANHQQYFLITNLANIPYSTGYIFQGFDQATFTRIVKVVLSGAIVASTPLNFYNIASMLMASATTSESAIPEEHRSLISIRAAFLYFRDKGPAFINVKDSWNQEYDKEMAKAKDFYKNVSKDPMFVQSLDPDAGERNVGRLRQNV